MHNLAENELDTLCYNINNVPDLKCSPFYNQIINYMSDTQLNFFHVQCECGHIDVVKYLLTETHFKEPINYSKKAYKKNNALFLIANRLSSVSNQTIMNNLINTFTYLIEHTNLGTTFIDDRNNNDFNILMRLISHGDEKNKILINYLYNHSVIETLLLAKTEDKKNTFHIAALYDTSLLVKLLEIPIDIKNKEKAIEETLKSMNNDELYLFSSYKVAYEILNSYQEKIKLENQINTNSIKEKKIKL